MRWNIHQWKSINHRQRPR